VLAGALAVWAWNIPFLLYGLAVPVAILGLAWLPETRVRRHTSLRDYLAGFPAITRRPRLLVAFAAGFLRFFLDYGYFTYLPVYLALKRGTSSAEVGVLLAAFAVGAMLTASQAAHLARGHDPARVVFVGFLLAGLSVLAIPFLPFTLLVGASLFVYGLGNGIISPMQKSLLMRNAPADLRAGVVSLDRIVQQAAKTLAPAAMGVLLLVANVEAVFWTLGGLSLGSIALAGVLLTARSRQVPAVAVDPIRSS
jgi:predicted MFS family arabinose efflux permease